MADEKVEVQKQYALIQEAKKGREQFVTDMNSLWRKDATLDHLVDIIFRHIKDKRLQEECLTDTQAVLRLRLSDRLVDALLDRLFLRLQRGQTSKYHKHEGASFALSSLPNSMSVEWPKVRKALLEARADGEGR